MDLLGNKADLLGNKADLLGNKADLLGNEADLLESKVDHLTESRADLVEYKEDLIADRKELEEKVKEIAENCDAYYLDFQEYQSNSSKYLIPQYGTYTIRGDLHFTKYDCCECFKIWMSGRLFTTREYFMTQSTPYDQDDDMDAISLKMADPNYVNIHKDVKIYSPFIPSFSAERKRYAENFSKFTFGLDPMLRADYNFLSEIYFEKLDKEVIKKKVTDYYLAPVKKLLRKDIDGHRGRDPYWLPENSAEYNLIHIFGDKIPAWWRHIFVQLCHLRYKYNSYEHHCSKHSYGVECSVKYPNGNFRIPPPIKFAKLIGCHHKVIENEMNTNFRNIWNCLERMLGRYACTSTGICLNHQYSGMEACIEKFHGFLKMLDANDLRTLVYDESFIEYFKPFMSSAVYGWTSSQVEWDTNNDLFLTETNDAIERVMTAIVLYDNIVCTNFYSLSCAIDHECQAEEADRSFMLQLLEEARTEKDKDFIENYINVSNFAHAQRMDKYKIIRSYYRADARVAYLEWTSAILDFITAVSWEFGWKL
jgi:hypothetical protein